MFLEADVGHWEKVNQVNYLGMVYTLKAAVPAMVARNAGRILVTNSSGSFLGASATRLSPAISPNFTLAACGPGTSFCCGQHNTAYKIII
jgi:NAD(P)-dependent dehydrogenase (short-subunit alcohol dehydrogenase family)